MNFTCINIFIISSEDNMHLVILMGYPVSSRKVGERVLVLPGPQGSMTWKHLGCGAGLLPSMGTA